MRLSSIACTLRRAILPLSALLAQSGSIILAASDKRPQEYNFFGREVLPTRNSEMATSSHSQYHDSHPDLSQLVYEQPPFEDELSLSLAPMHSKVVNAWPDHETTSHDQHFADDSEPIGDQTEAAEPRDYTTEPVMYNEEAVEDPSDGYGYPFPFWPQNFPEDPSAFERALFVYTQHTKSFAMKYSYTKFKYRCNTLIAHELFSKDEERIKSAINWIQKGFRNPPLSGKIRKMMGEEQMWVLIYEIAARFGWSLDWTIYHISNVMTNEMTEEYKRTSKWDGRDRKLGELIEEVFKLLQEKTI